MQHLNADLALFLAVKALLNGRLTRREWEMLRLLKARDETMQKQWNSIVSDS